MGLSGREHLCLEWSGQATSVVGLARLREATTTHVFKKKVALPCLTRDPDRAWIKRVWLLWSGKLSPLL